VQFKPSEAFEKNRLEIKITVSDGVKAGTIIRRLAEIPPLEWDSLIYPAFVPPGETT
jgi:hypothetical protein